MKLQRQRQGDSAEMAFIELVDRSGEMLRPRPVGSAVLAMASKVGAEAEAEAVTGASKGNGKGNGVNVEK